MYQIAEGLFQAPACTVNTLPDVDVIFWCCGGSHPIPEFGKQVVIDYSFNDDPNGTDPETYANLKTLAKFVRNQRVLTVCQAGQNRSGLVSALILKARGFTTEQAISTVQAQNGALWNPGFLGQLRGLNG